MTANDDPRSDETEEPPPPASRPRPRLVLASASPRRADLLRTLGVRFAIVAADIDETPRSDEEPAALAERLAMTKAAAVAVDRTDVVVAADTIVVIDGEILGQPADEADARRMLRRLSGRVHEVVTAIAVRIDDRCECSTTRVPVTFVELTEADIDWYLATGEPRDKAGAYGIQGIGGLFVDRIDGNHQAVVGLPLPVLNGLLHTLGHDLRDWSTT